MREYFKFFRVPFIVIAALAVVAVILSVILGDTSSDEIGVRTNTECTTEERVFDYADKLTDSEEDMLRSLIAEKEKETGCDIVVVTLDESLVEYAAQYEDEIGPVSMDQCVMVFADNFYDENKFGYDKPYGDGVLLLDNWYREADGSVYSWMSTSGKAYDAYSESMIDSILDDSLEYVDSDPYEAYSYFVERFALDMSSGADAIIDLFLSPFFILIVSILAAVIFLAVNWSGKKGKRTTDERTYVAGGRPNIRHRADTFLYKNVTQRHIETSSGSSSGGGGGHISSGGQSHGGGGHSR